MRETTNSKLSVEQMAERMKCETVNGLYYFLPGEYLQPSQIRGFITRLKKQSNYLHDSFIGVNESEEAGIEANLDTICGFALHSDDEDFEGFDVDQ